MLVRITIRDPYGIGFKTALGERIVSATCSYIDSGCGLRKLLRPFYQYPGNFATPASGEQATDAIG